VTIGRAEFHEGSLVVAHRGASAAQPENTLPAFQAALEAGADAVELDVRLTSDGVPVVMHDADVAASTNGSGFVHAMTLADVKRLDASRGSGIRAEVPTLAEVLDTIGDRGGLDIEIKNLPGEPAFDSPEEAILKATLEALEASSFPGPVLISSFNWLTIERCKQLAPEIPTGFLSIAAIDAHAALVYTRNKGHDFVLPQTPALLEAGETLIREAHEHGVRVGTWVADEASTLETLFGWGVDAIACNDPAAAVAVRARVLAAQ
jgi:glycerophosphoryl diester phosphodiesterase